MTNRMNEPYHGFQIRRGYDTPCEHSLTSILHQAYYQGDTVPVDVDSEVRETMKYLASRVCVTLHIPMRPWGINYQSIYVKG
jgi:hypothetical protein